MSQQIQVLSDIEHIRKHPSMYIGTLQPFRLLAEVLDNAIDETLHGATTITVQLDSTENTIVVSDDGRGIPDETIYVEPLKTHLHAVVAVCTVARSSGKFDNYGTESLVGLHGIGLTAVCALSEYMEVTIKSGTYVFQRGKFVRHVKSRKQSKGTTILFRPDPSIFYHDTDVKSEFETCLDYVLQRFGAVLLLYPNVRLVLKGRDGVVLFDSSQYNDTQLGLKLLVYGRDYLRNAKDIPDLMFVAGHSTTKINELDTARIQLYRVSEPRDEFTTIVAVNTLVIPQHNLLNRLAKEIDVTPSELKRLLNDHLLLYVARVSEIAFTSQEKVGLAKPRSLVDLLSTQTWNVIVRTVAERYKQRKAELELELEHLRRQLQQKQRKLQKDSSYLKTSKLKPAKVKGEKAVLYLVEGDSAAGTLLRIRDPQYEAVLPLRGKITIGADKSLQDLLKNPYVQDLLTIYDGNKWRYGKVVIIADPDEDGLHISWLAIGLLIKLFPQLVLEKRVYKLDVPLYGTWNDKQFIPIYDERIAQEYQRRGYKVFRYKGLGEMDPEELKHVIVNGRYRLVTADNPTIKQVMSMIDLNKLELVERLKELVGTEG